MHLWTLLFLAVLGIFAFHLGSYLAVEEEKEEIEMPYLFYVLFAMFGMFVSASCFTKIARRMESMQNE